MGVEEKIVVFRLLSQFLSKALFFIDSRARVAKLNKFVNSVAEKVLIKQENCLSEKNQGLSCAQGAHEKNTIGDGGSTAL